MRMEKARVDVTLHNCFIADGSDFLQSVNITDVPVSFNTSATNGSQYCLDIEIYDDNVIEEDETFSVHLSVGFADRAVSPVYTAVTIIDNDGKSFSDYKSLYIHS